VQRLCKRQHLQTPTAEDQVQRMPLSKVKDRAVERER